MGLTNLDTALLDMIPSDCKLCIERDFGYIILTLRHGDRTQCYRIHSNVSRRMYDDTNITGSTLDLKMDLCQECMRRFHDFINNKDEI